VAAEQFEDAVDFVAGIDDERFAGRKIADDRAIALQHPHGNGDLYESLVVGIGCGLRIGRHSRQYSIGGYRLPAKMTGGPVQ
jgi:hypothetical protein